MTDQQLLVVIASGGVVAAFTPANRVKVDVAVDAKTQVAMGRFEAMSHAQLVNLVEKVAGMHCFNLSDFHG